MAIHGYNTFVVMDCKKRTPLLVTSSARKSTAELQTGRRIEVWNAHKLVERIYAKEKCMMNPYIAAEKKHHRKKQQYAEFQNRKVMVGI